jgi:hypothetical protein
MTMPDLRWRRSFASADRRQQAPDFVEQFGNRRLVTREVLEQRTLE